MLNGVNVGAQCAGPRGLRIAPLHIPSFHQLNGWMIYILQSPNVEAIRESPLHLEMHKSYKSSPRTRGMKP
ncbi:hypothetical protein Oscil6304_3905 [Oscillatoria acuminata PCC 6304]|uniref:Uncharacterized protein n=1 Tax=Oscillatoria acuminata PCC 6304 TaxID=56110 RepID=K9TN55_9CYAN|nr:hypothetical protein Oscil6304_3905 [Oscillatoria acuminata PCC 6304]